MGCGITLDSLGTQTAVVHVAIFEKIMFKKGNLHSIWCIFNIFWRWGWDHEEKKTRQFPRSPFWHLTGPHRHWKQCQSLPHRSPRLSLLQTAVLLALGAPPLLQLVIVLWECGRNEMVLKRSCSYWNMVSKIGLYKALKRKMLLTQHCAHMHCFRIHAMSSSKKKPKTLLHFSAELRGAPFAIGLQHVAPKTLEQDSWVGMGCYLYMYNIHIC